MKRLFLYIPVVFVLLVLLFSCGGAGDGFPDIGSVTIEFTDTDMGSGQIAGTAIITPAADETDIDSYVVYWGSSDSDKVTGLDEIADVSVTGSQITITIPENTEIPSEAEYFLAYVKNAEGESLENANLPIIDLGSTVTVTVSQSLSNVNGMSLEVTGDDMTAISETGSASTTEFVVEVPDGSSRLFEVVTDIDPSDPGAGLAFRGRNTTDLSPGVPASFTITVDQVCKTKIIIPEPNTDGFGSSRIVQINNFTTPALQEILDTDVSGLVGTFYPWDIDFDSHGNIYIANNWNPVTTQADDDIVFRIDNFTDATQTTVVPSTDPDLGVVAIAIDRNNSYLYYTRGNNLARVDLSGTIPSLGTALDLSDFTSPNFIGLAVDDEGYLYIADAGTDPDQVVKYNPGTASIVGTPYTNNLDFERSTSNWGIQNLADIIVKGDYVYVANHDGPDNYEIIQLNKSLQYEAGYGSKPLTYPDETQGSLYGPHHFAAVLGKEELYIIDEGEDGSSPHNKLVSMDDMNGTNWDVFDPTDFSETAFEFYYGC